MCFKLVDYESFFKHNQHKHSGVTTLSPALDVENQLVQLLKEKTVIPKGRSYLSNEVQSFNQIHRILMTTSDQSNECWPREMPQRIHKSRHDDIIR